MGSYDSINKIDQTNSNITNRVEYMVQTKRSNNLLRCGNLLLYLFFSLVFTFLPNTDFTQYTRYSCDSLEVHMKNENTQFESRQRYNNFTQIPFQMLAQKFSYLWQPPHWNAIDFDSFTTLLRYFSLLCVDFVTEQLYFMSGNPTHCDKLNFGFEWKSRISGNYGIGDIRVCPAYVVSVFDRKKPVSITFG